MIIQNTDLSIDNPASPTTFICRMIHIQYNFRIFTGGVLIAVNTVSLSSGQFYIDILILQHYLIITGAGFLLVMGECGRGASATGRHQCNVDQVRSSRTTQTGMAKAKNGTPVIVIPGSIAPVGRFTGVRRKLYHTKR